jgi:hypothetical protein
MKKFIDFYYENYNLPDNFVPKFGSCMIAAEILTKKVLRERKDFKVIEGYITFPTVDWKNTHTWIEFEDGDILDPTKGQWGIDGIIYLQKGRVEYEPSAYLNLCKKYPIENRKQYFRDDRNI